MADSVTQRMKLVLKLEAVTHFISFVYLRVIHSPQNTLLQLILKLAEVD